MCFYLLNDPHRSEFDQSGACEEKDHPKYKRSLADYLGCCYEVSDEEINWGIQMAALVTGASQRIGRAIAINLANRGHDVIVHYSTSKAEAEETVSIIRDIGRSAVALQADLLNDEQIYNLFKRSTDFCGPLTVLINNASIFEDDSLQTATRESWDRHMGSNLRAPFVLTQCFASQVPNAASDGEPVAQGLIINMIDQRVHKLTPQFMSYTLAKSALWTFTQTAAQALAPNVRVNAIGPGPTLKGVRQSEEDFLKQRRATLLQRGTSLDDITAAVNYFLDACSTTGQIICPDGGQHLAWETPDVLGIE